MDASAWTESALSAPIQHTRAHFTSRAEILVSLGWTRRSSTRVQLMSARTPVQISTAPSMNQECRVETGLHAP